VTSGVYWHWVRALTVPMHLGLIYEPFVPHNLISAQDSPVPLPRFQMAPRLKILMSSGSKEGTQIYHSFLSKSPGKRIPSRSPHGVPMERDTRLQGIFTSLLIYLFISKALRQNGPSMFPKSGAPMEIDAHLQSLFYPTARVPSKAVFPSHSSPPPQPLSLISQSPQAITPYCKMFLYKSPKCNAVLNLIVLVASFGVINSVLVFQLHITATGKPSWSERLYPPHHVPLFMKH